MDLEFCFAKFHVEDKEIEKPIFFCSSYYIMSNTGYKISTGADLITVFNPYVSGSQATATGFKIAGGSDLNTVFAPLNGGSQATATGFKIAGGSDLNTVFAKYLNFPFTIPNTLSYSTSVINGYNVLIVTSGTGTVTYNSSNDLQVEAIGGGGGPGYGVIGGYNSGWYSNGGNGGGGAFGWFTTQNTSFKIKSIVITSIGSQGNIGSSGGNTSIQMNVDQYGGEFYTFTANGGTSGSNGIIGTGSNIKGGNGGNGGTYSSSNNMTHFPGYTDVFIPSFSNGQAGSGGSSISYSGSSGTGSSTAPSVRNLGTVTYGSPGVCNVNSHQTTTINYSGKSNTNNRYDSFSYNSYPGAVIIYGW